MTPEGMGETSPLNKADILRTLPDDDEAGARQEKGEPPVISMRCRSVLISWDAASVLAPPGATSGPAAAPASAPRAGVPVPRVAKLSGFRLPKRRDYAMADQ